MNDRTVLLRANIRKIYAITAGTGALFAVPIMIPFLEENGLTLAQVFLLQSVYALGMAVLEIPSGYLSDRWGRRNTLVVGAFGIFLGILTYALSSGFHAFMLAELFFAVGMSFHSGTIEAMLYDTLLELDEVDRYRRVQGQEDFLHFGAEAAASMLAGFVATFISLRANLWITLLPVACACVCCFTLVEPHRHKLQETRHWKAIWDVCTHAFLRNRALRNIILIHGVTSTLTMSLFWFTQPYQELVGLPLAFFGITHAVIVFAGALASQQAARISKRIDDRVFLLLICATVVGGYLLLSGLTAMAGLLIFLAVRIAWGFLGPLTADLLNRMTTSSVRATVLSLRSFSFRIVFIFTAPALGRLADTRNLGAAFLAAGIIGGLLLIALFVRMRPMWSEIPK